MRKLRFLFILFLISSTFYAQESITINAGTDSGAFRNYTGFVHGETNLRTKPKGLDLLAKLKPHFWRSSYNISNRILADSLTCKSSLVISDLYANYKGGTANAKPWLNWTEYETYIDTLFTVYKKAGLAPTFWDVWNEPDIFYWSGTFDQFVECIVRTRKIANKVDTAIKLVAPSLNYYNGNFMEAFLDTLVYNGIKLDAVSWHEFGLPSHFTANFTDFRNRMKLNPQWGKLEIHINEFSPQETHQVPAFRVGWLYDLEKSNADWANLACWDNNFDGATQWSGCWNGLNGLMWYDEQSPLPVYWVQRAYAEMLNGKRLFCTSSDTKTLALSAKNDGLQEMRILAGRFYSIDNGQYIPVDVGKDSSNVTITINNYPFLNSGTVPLFIQRIPKGNPIYQNTPLLAPITIFNGTVNVTNANVILSLPNFKDGDVYYIYLNSTNILFSDEKIERKESWSIYPNPTLSSVHISTEGIMVNSKIEVINYLGEIVKEQIISYNDFEIDLSAMNSGIYFIRIGNSVQKVIKY